ncbi:hypothetical protein [Streptomyces sp. NPDC029526]|uniref:hypothetical protein n=1 Tax=Streptomyces sp. NPDC029526 TaxID=3155728 RepID=UPI0033D6B8A1
MTAHDDRGDDTRDDDTGSDDIHGDATSGDAVRPDGTHGDAPRDDRTYEDRPPEDRVDADGGSREVCDRAARDAAGHGGTLPHGSADPLMTAILAEEPSEDDRRDPAFMAEHEAAVADLAVLREQLAFLGEALAEPSDAVPDTGTGDGVAAGNAEAAMAAEDTEATEATEATEDTEEAESTPAAEDAVPVDPTSGATGRMGPTGPPALTGGPSAPAGPGGSTGPGRSRGSRGPRGRGGSGRRRRPLRVALGTLAVATAATFVAGLGWLVVQPGAGQETSSADAGAPAAGRGDAGADEDGAKSERAEERPPVGDPRWLACARLVAEGVVTATEPVPGSGARSGEQRVTLTVTRVHAGEEATTVTFLHGTAGASVPAVGDRLLVGLPRKGDRPDLVVTGVQNIALTRTWITSALPEANRLACE